MHGPDLAYHVSTDWAPGKGVLVHLLPVLQTATMKHVATGGHHGGQVQQEAGRREGDPAEGTDDLGEKLLLGEDGGVRPEVDGGATGKAVVCLRHLCKFAFLCLRDSMINEYFLIILYSFPKKHFHRFMQRLFNCFQCTIKPSSGSAAERHNEVKVAKRREEDERKEVRRGKREGGMKGGGRGEEEGEMGGGGNVGKEAEEREGERRKTSGVILTKIRLSKAQNILPCPDCLNFI